MYGQLSVPHCFFWHTVTYSNQLASWKKTGDRPKAKTYPTQLAKPQRKTLCNRSMVFVRQRRWSEATAAREHAPKLIPFVSFAHFWVPFLFLKKPCIPLKSNCFSHEGRRFRNRIFSFAWSMASPGWSTAWGNHWKRGLSYGDGLKLCAFLSIGGEIRRTATCSCSRGSKEISEIPVGVRKVVPLLRHGFISSYMFYCFWNSRRWHWAWWFFWAVPSKWRNNFLLSQELAAPETAVNGKQEALDLHTALWFFHIFALDSLPFSEPSPWKSLVKHWDAYRATIGPIDFIWTLHYDLWQIHWVCNWRKLLAALAWAVRSRQLRDGTWSHQWAHGAWCTCPSKRHSTRSSFCKQFNLREKRVSLFSVNLRVRYTNLGCFDLFVYQLRKMELSNMDILYDWCKATARRSSFRNRMRWRPRDFNRLLTSQCGQFWNCFEFVSWNSWCHWLFMMCVFQLKTRANMPLDCKRIQMWEWRKPLQLVVKRHLVLYLFRLLTYLHIWNSAK